MWRPLPSLKTVALKASHLAGRIFRRFQLAAADLRRLRNRIGDSFLTTSHTTGGAKNENQAERRDSQHGTREPAVFDWLEVLVSPARFAVQLAAAAEGFFGHITLYDTKHPSPPFILPR